MVGILAGVRPGPITPDAPHLRQHRLDRDGPGTPTRGQRRVRPAREPLPHSHRLVEPLPRRPSLGGAISHVGGEVIVMSALGGYWVGAVFDRRGNAWTVRGFEGGDIKERARRRRRGALAPGAAKRAASESQRPGRTTTSSGTSRKENPGRRGRSSLARLARRRAARALGAGRAREAGGSRGWTWRRSLPRRVARRFASGCESNWEPDLAQPPSNVEASSRPCSHPNATANRRASVAAGLSCAPPVFLSTLPY